MKAVRNDKEKTITIDYEGLSNVIDVLGELLPDNPRNTALDQVYMELLGHYDCIHADAIDENRQRPSKEDREAIQKRFIRSVNLVRNGVDKTNEALETSLAELSETITKHVSSLEGYTAKDIGNKLIDISTLMVTADLLQNEIKSGINRCVMLENLCRRILLKEQK